MANKELQYRTFNELLDEVRLDFNMYELESMIDPAQLIKVAQRVNYDLGLRISSNQPCLLLRQIYIQRIFQRIHLFHHNFYRINP